MLKFYRKKNKQKKHHNQTINKNGWVFFHTNTISSNKKKTQVTYDKKV